MLSIIIPTLNADRTLAATLDSCFCRAANVQVIVSDGGSADGTVAVAEHYDCMTISGESGRGRQLLAGGLAADGSWLLFLHADSRLPGNWYQTVSTFMNNPANVFRAATFHLQFDDTCPQARRVEWFVKWRTRLLGLPYGDQGLLISRRFYDRLGGFMPLPIMEDVDLVRRVGRANLRLLDTSIITSAHKYQRDGYWKRPLRNLGLVCLYWLGVPTAKLARYY